MFLSKGEKVKRKIGRHQKKKGIKINKPNSIVTVKIKVNSSKV